MCYVKSASRVSVGDRAGDAALGASSGYASFPRVSIMSNHPDDTLEMMSTNGNDAYPLEVRGNDAYTLDAQA